MSEFKREDRYAVIKWKDLSEDQMVQLTYTMQIMDIPTRECVVVEADSPVYQVVWDLIEAVWRRDNK
jgi:hypothetical protein